MPHRLPAASAAAALAAVLVACGGGDNGSGNAEKAAKSAEQKASQAVTEVTGGRVSVAMNEYSFTPSTLSARAGRLKVTAIDRGQQQHEFVLLRTDAAPDAIPLEDGAASENDAVGEISERQPGQSGTHTFKLKPGRYVFICNVDSHYKAGMRGSLVVK